MDQHRSCLLISWYPRALTPLLRSGVADLIEVEGITAMDLLDVVVHQDMTGDGPWWSVTVHWSPESPEDDG